ncbi:MAG: TonB-dependent receptor, partial [Acidobacteria bacterium]|nr:TonB-dependent receptor [Acidobacteriota bacterium]
RPTPVTRVAAAVTVIDQAEMARELATDIRQLVRYEPGIAVRNDPFRFGLNGFSVRGLGGNRVRVEIDGVPVAGGLAVGAYADSGRRFVDLAFLERVEILRGPASSLYGSDAIGGIVALSTLRPATLLDKVSGRTALRTEVGYQTADAGWHAAAIGAIEFGAAELLLGYVRRQGHEMETAADVTPDPQRRASDAVLLKYVLPRLSGGPLTVTAEGGRVRQRSAVNAFLGTPGRFVNTTALLGEDAARRARLSLGQSLAAAPGFGNLQWRIYWQDTDTQQDSFERRKAVPPRTPPLGIDRQFRLAESALGAEVIAVRSTPGRRFGRELVLGLEVAHRRIRERRDGVQTDLASGAVTRVILGEALPVRDLPVSDVSEIGIFAEDEIGFGATPWTLVPALRVDDYRLQPRPDRIYLEGNPRSPAVALHRISLSPKLGATWRLDESLSVFFQYAHGFRSPPPEDVNIGLYVAQLNYRALPNPDLEPEKSDGYELGLRWRSPALDLTGSLYDNEYRDFIDSKINIGVEPVTGTTLFQSRNVSTARISGAELALRVRAQEIWPRLAGWSGRLRAALTRGTDLARDQPLNSVGPASAVAGLRFDAASGRWGSELTATAVAPKRRIDRSRADLYGTDGCLSLDWRVDARLGRRLQLNAGFFNLGNQACIDWEDVRGRVAGDPLLPYYTRPGRNAALTLRWGV